jgi:hypothetical protein
MAAPLQGFQGTPTMNSQQMPVFGAAGAGGTQNGMPQAPGGISHGVPGLSPNPLAQQQQNQMLIKLLQQGGQ